MISQSKLLSGERQLPPALDRFDHIHVFVTDRAEAELWFRRILNLHRDADLVFWSSGGGPLMLRNTSKTIMLAVFEGPLQASRSTIAFAVGANQFLTWLSHLEESLDRKIDVVDHEVSWSIYFKDPDGNSYEITSYDYAILAIEQKTPI